MAYSVILHLAGEPSILGEVDELPKPSDNLIIVSNPRLRDGKDLHYLEHNVVKVMWPVNKSNADRNSGKRRRRAPDRLCEGIIHA